MTRKKARIIAIVVIGILALYAGFFNQTPSSALSVRRVIDGDTVVLSNGETVRYIGIDTPELKQKNGDVWISDPRPYAEEARDFNRSLIAGRTVRLELDVQKRDKYGRLLAYVYNGDKMINLEMVKEGYAMVYTYPPNIKHVNEFLSAQRKARQTSKGLWWDMERNVISADVAEDNIGLIRIVETEVLSTFLTEKVLMLNCNSNFKVVIFKSNLMSFPKEATRSPNAYFKDKAVRVYGLIKSYKGSSQIVLHDPSQIELI